jgi:hypothetical protein
MNATFGYFVHGSSSFFQTSLIYFVIERIKLKMASKSSKESPTFNCELEFNVNVDKKTTGQNLVDQVVKALGIRGVNILISYFFMK